MLGPSTDRLDHWDRTQVYDLLPLEDVVRFVGQTHLPVIIDAMARYRLTLPLQFQSGSQSTYCNLGYLFSG